MKKNVYKILLALSLSGAVLAGCDTIDSNIGTNNEENVEEKANEEGDVEISEIRVDVTSRYYRCCKRSRRIGRFNHKHAESRAKPVWMV